MVTRGRAGKRSKKDDSTANQISVEKVEANNPETTFTNEAQLLASLEDCDDEVRLSPWVQRVTPCTRDNAITLKVHNRIRPIIDILCRGLVGLVS